MRKAAAWRIATLLMLGEHERAWDEFSAQDPRDRHSSIPGMAPILIEQGRTADVLRLTDGVEWWRRAATIDAIVRVLVRRNRLPDAISLMHGIDVAHRPATASAIAEALAAIGRDVDVLALGDSEDVDWASAPALELTVQVLVRTGRVD